MTDPTRADSGGLGSVEQEALLVDFASMFHGCTTREVYEYLTPLPDEAQDRAKAAMRLSGTDELRRMLDEIEHGWTPTDAERERWRDSDDLLHAQDDGHDPD